MTTARVGYYGQRAFHNLICFMYKIGMWDTSTAQAYIDESSV